MASHSSVLAWEIPWTEEPGGLQSSPWGCKTVGHDLVTQQQQPLKHNFLFLLWPRTHLILRNSSITREISVRALRTTCINTEKSVLGKSHTEVRILSSTMFSINKVLENLNMEASCYLNGRQTCRRTHRRWGAGEEAQELGTLVCCWWEGEVVQSRWKTAWRLLKRARYRIAVWSSNIDFSLI